ncbi:MAG TPA: AAA family ATPase, partial [Gemmatimonadaceae bacterium]|nr:AAA family ATPase [Gemmatimonadaceae bacterium]
RRVVERYGGTIEKFIGDAVMAVWGTPVAHEDDAERAVRTGLELVDAVAALGREAGLELAARAGVMTGEAAVALHATNQGMVAGDMVNTASRLQSVAAPGTVLVGERTLAATEQSIAYEPAGEQQLKGKPQPVATFRALRVVAQRGGAGRSTQLEPPFVGRQTELRMLKDLFHATGAERRPRLVSVIGQAGIGKSRLAWELQKYLDGLTEVAFWHHGRCPAYGEGISFWALNEMVRARIGLAEGEGGEAGMRRLDETLAEHVPDPAERAWIRPALGELLGFTSGAQRGGVRDTLFAAWRTFFERLAAQGTCILVFEDLQWADPGQLEFIEHLLEWSRNYPIYILTLSRPELLEKRPDWAAGWRGATSITLEPLPDDAMRELLDGLVPGLPDAACARILERAEGVPLYAVETVRMLLADGRIEPHEGAYRPAGDLADLAVPQTLHALVAARLDALDGPMRTLVQEASVLGKTFGVAALAALHGGEEGELDRVLRDLVRRELFEVDADPRSPERGQYGFVQAVIREVAYGTLARRERRRLHLAAARYFESLEDDEISGALAGHYLDAYRARPEGPEGAAVATQARLALRAAAERANRLRSFDLAQHYLELALEVARDDAERAELSLLVGRAAFDAVHLAESERYLSSARDLYRQLGDRDGELRAVAARGLTQVSANEVENELDGLVAAGEEFADLDGTLPYATLCEVIARGHMRAGHHPEAVVWADRGLPVAERFGDERLVLELLVTRATVLGVMGRVTEAITAMNGVRRMATERGYVEIVARACINLGFVLSPIDLREGYAVSKEGAELALRMGLRGYAAFLVGNACEAAYHLGEWETLELLPRRALELNLDPALSGHVLMSSLGLAVHRGEPYEERLAELRALLPPADPQARAGASELEAEIALLHGRYPAAFERALHALEQLREAVMPGAPAVAGRAMLWSGDVQGARRVVALLDPGEGPMVAALLEELNAGIHALEGSVSAAEEFIRALAFYRDLGVEFERACCQITMAATLPATRREIAPAVAEAREVLGRLRARRLLERLDEILERRGGEAAQPPRTAAREQVTGAANPVS